MKYKIWNNFHDNEIIMEINIPLFIENHHILSALEKETGKLRRYAMRKRREIIKKLCTGNPEKCLCITKIGGETLKTFPVFFEKEMYSIASLEIEADSPENAREIVRARMQSGEITADSLQWETAQYKDNSFRAEI